MPFTAEYLNASFGSSRTGIGTVGYTLMKDDGTVSVARTQTGVVEEGGGVYGKANISILDDSASILWDTGGGTPLYAAEDLEPARKQAELEAKLPAGNIASPGDEMALVDDAITSAKHDEATSFPLAQADGGASEVARTGADGDTLETLSDQIDGTAVPGSEMNLADDAITAPKYDETTAFPVKSDDAGATQIARTGADGDTLETLSDQIDTRESTTDAAAREAAVLAAIAALNNLSIADVQTALTNQGYTSARAAMIELSKKMLINRLELADGDTDNWILYDDDDTTPLLTFSVKNKNAGAIDLPTAAPARRTRGV
jgi:hypothetical protein